ncbi:conserved hypothetical protein [Trichinella spiralis]|uniref:hypothetical protein n=1 Tax=Trichinella spiralis TaxID=6334 RepID=UPI0001EFBDC1|nr:conserved hypothetical protein [Trichinella spiralis]
MNTSKQCKIQSPTLRKPLCRSMFVMYLGLSLSKLQSIDACSINQYAAKSELEKLKEIELDRHVIGTIDKKFPETGSIMQITIIIKMPYHQQRCACLFDIRGRCEQWKKVCVVHT